MKTKLVAIGRLSRGKSPRRKLWVRNGITAGKMRGNYKQTLCWRTARHLYLQEQLSICVVNYLRCIFKNSLL